MVEYDRGGARIRQTTEVRRETLELLKQLHVSPPPKLHAIDAHAAATEAPPDSDELGDAEPATDDPARA